MLIDFYLILFVIIFLGVRNFVFGGLKREVRVIFSLIVSIGLLLLIFLEEGVSKGYLVYSVLAFFVSDIVFNVFEKK